MPALSAGSAEFVKLIRKTPGTMAWSPVKFRLADGLFFPYTSSMIYRWLLPVLLLMSAPALAQDNVIRVIKDDGTEAVFEIPEPERASIPPATPQPQRSPEILPKAAEPAAKPVKPGKPMAATKPSSVFRPVEPVRVSPEKLIAAPPADETGAKPGKTEVRRPKPVARSKPAPAPRRAAVSEPKMADPSKSATGTPAQILPSTTITADLAKAIALDHAPPARTMSVTRRTYEGKPVFVVTFKTESGPYDVLVDAASGAVLTP